MTEDMETLEYRLNKLCELYSKLIDYRDMLLKEQEGIDYSNLQNVLKKEQLLVLSGSFNEILMVLNESKQTTASYMRLLLEEKTKEM